MIFDVEFFLVLQKIIIGFHDFFADADGKTTQESKDALIAMLNLVLERTDDPIIDITHLNPFSIAEAKSEKVIIMDVKVETSKNELIDVEMQVGDMDVYINRTLRSFISVSNNKNDKTSTEKDMITETKESYFFMWVLFLSKF